MAEPTHEEATVLRKDYLKTAFETLEEGIKKNLEDLRDKFDQKTKRAIDDLISKKPDGLPEDTLSGVEIFLKAIRHNDYHRLTIQEKGSLQRWALAKRLDNSTVEGLAHIKVKHQNQEDTEDRATDESPMTLEDMLLVCGEQKRVTDLKRKVFKFLGKEISVNSLWAGMVDTFDKLKLLGDTAASSNQTAGLVWGIFKVLLQFAVLGEKRAEAAFSGMQTTVNVMQRAATYEKHIYGPAGRQTLGQLAIEPFETCLISTYQRVFKFLVLGSKCFTKNKASLCWYVFWSDKDILEFEQDIFKYEQILFQMQQ
ncbi:hypothetical protein NW752_009068 [Fusarium irregulare]|uniref:Uncharacterized protein n=1 Tax=Fusarium irregulare TaxID=2494466 RepID=A0A9W8PKX0_9HYPO|nr:hypothetical protein NW766_008594 [Fusarium irregulare]KAJ4009894.1 hypothetical protein NW752_009068 [Fusarium irregulare]